MAEYNESAYKLARQTYIEHSCPFERALLSRCVVVSRSRKLNLAERQIPIRVGFARSALEDPSLLSTLRVPGTNGAPVPLSAVARIENGSGPSRIGADGRCGPA